jgi:hypothetical protein
LVDLIHQYGAAGVFSDGADGMERVVAVATIVRRLLATVTGRKGGFDTLARALHTVLTADALAGAGRAKNDAAVQYWAAYFAREGSGDRRVDDATVENTTVLRHIQSRHLLP